MQTEYVRKIRVCGLELATHFEPSELTEPSLESFELCFASLGLFAGITSELLCTPLVIGLLPPRKNSKNRQGVMT